MELDILQNPKIVADLVKKEIIKNKKWKEFDKNKTSYNWCKNADSCN